MAQKDAKVNIGLAENSATISKASLDDSAAMRTLAAESKKDSAAMKTISILGMFFLPGTFVAVSFVLPRCIFTSAKKSQEHRQVDFNC
jgi:Mg2+ and Co2+ transporter CorA